MTSKEYEIALAAARDMARDVVIRINRMIDEFKLLGVEVQSSMRFVDYPTAMAEYGRGKWVRSIKWPIGMWANVFCKGQFDSHFCLRNIVSVEAQSAQWQVSDTEPKS